MIIHKKRQRKKRGKKIHKTVKAKKTISISRKKGLCRPLLSNRKQHRIQNITNNQQSGPKMKTAHGTKKREKGKKKIKMMIIRDKEEKYSKNKMQVPRGGVPRPPSQFESYSLSASSKSYSGRSYSAPKPD